MSFDMNIKVFGLEHTLRQLKAANADTEKVLKQESAKIVDDIIAAAQAKASTPQQSAVAAIMRASKTSKPAILVPSRQYPPNREANSMQVYYGAEFGGRRTPRTQQFPPFVGQTGYFLWPAIRERDNNAKERFRQVVEELWQRTFGS